MYRLAIIAIESGACVANPVYETEKECFDQVNKIYNSGLGKEIIQFNEDVDGRKYIVPVKPRDFIAMIEPVNDEEI